MLTVRSDPSAEDEYRRYWHAFDPWGQSARLRHDTSGEVLAEEMISYESLQRTSYYAGFAPRYDLVRCMVDVIDAVPQAHSVLSTGRARRQRAFATDEGRIATALMPHLRQALALHRRIAAAECASADLAEALNRMTSVAFLVESSGNVTWTNRAADQLIASNKGLVIDCGELRAA